MKQKINKISQFIQRFGIDRPYLAATTLGLLFCQALFVQSSIIGTLLTWLYLTICTVALRHRLSLKTAFPTIWAFLILLGSITLLSAGVYLLYAIPAAVQWSVLAAPLLLYLKRPQSLFSLALLPKRDGWLLLGSIVLAIPFCWLILQARTNELLRAPWNALPAAIFALYAVNLGWMINVIKQAKSDVTKLLATMIVFFLSSSVVLFIYAIGFGFDPFVHRATMSWIQEFGAITPKQPYYLGQYMLSVLAQTTTGLSIHTIDRWLIPFLATLILPTISISAMQLYTKKTHRFGMMLAFWVLPLYAFISYGVTVPYIFSVLFTLLSIFAMLGVRAKALPWYLPWLCILPALITQPLIAAPAATWLFFLSVIPAHQFKHRWLYTLFVALMVGLAVPTLFTIQAWRVGSGFPEISNPLLTLDAFLVIFERPYWYLPERSSLILELLYTWQRILAPFVGVLGLIGIWLMRKHKYRDLALASLAGVLGVWLTAWLLRSWFVFPGVINYEQINYPTRLLVTSVLFLFPWAMVTTSRMVTWFWNHRYVIVSRTVFVSGFVFLLVVSLYLSYPQRNHKARYPGYNVTKYDVAAVQWIDAQEEDDQYLVLSNQIVSAAALQELRFRTYFDTTEGELYQYPIPTGGPLYQFYGPMLYDDNKRETIEDAMNLMGVDSAYVVVNGYWGDIHRILASLRPVADMEYMIGDGDVWVFGFER